MTAVQDDAAMQIVGKVNGRSVTRGELKAAFALVEPKEGWKFPINALIPAKTELALITEAVIFFTGSTPKFAKVGRKIRVTAAGYYATCGA